MPLICPSVFEELRQTSGDDLLDALIDAFLDEGPKMLAAMQAARATADLDVFRRNAHSLKTNAETFGATDLAVGAKSLEVAARAGTIGSATQMESLLEAYRAAAVALQELRELREPRP